MAPVQRPRMRPRFVLPVTETRNDVIHALKNRLQNHEICTGQFFREEVRLGINPGNATLWSPYLHARFEETDSGGIDVHGLFLPHPNVWTAFMAAYGVLCMCGLLGAMYGFAQMGLDETPWAFWAVPAALGAIAFVYGAALIGQGLSAEHMYILRTLLDDAVEDAKNGTPRRQAGDGAGLTQRSHACIVPGNP